MRQEPGPRIGDCIEVPHFPISKYVVVPGFGNKGDLLDDNAAEWSQTVPYGIEELLLLLFFDFHRDRRSIDVDRFSASNGIAALKDGHWIEVAISATAIAAFNLLPFGWIKPR